MNKKNIKSTFYYLAMADDSCLRLKACDLQVAPFVERFAEVCSMEVALPDTHGNLLSCYIDSYANIASFRENHPEMIATGRGPYCQIFFDPSFANSFIFFNLDEFQTEDMKNVLFCFIDSTFQLQMVSRGNCAPCHCALVEINGRGAVIGGRGDSGKTTCTRRLPEPHRALADDYVMLFGHQDKLLAQAMPTWSNLYNGDLAYRADCTQITEVNAFFFLKQSRTDHIERIDGIKATSHLNEILQDLLTVRVITDMPDTMKKKLRSRIFDFAVQVVDRKPTGILHASLEGEFWNPLEIFLQARIEVDFMRSLSNSNYIGPSMSPVLKPGDGLILNPDVTFDDLRRGDVVCFKSPHIKIHVTHRIVAITPGGLITRGDNNPESDPDPITAEQNPLLLTHIRRSSLTIRIHGGAMGMMVHRKNQTRRFIKRYIVSPLIPALKKIIASLADSGFLYRVNLLDNKISVFQFNRDGKATCMLIWGKRRIGHLKDNGKWHIRIPWRFFVDPQKLTKYEKNGFPGTMPTYLSDE